ncbi:MAG: hypothetical protein F6K35_06785 [Okeania sp. SIO2H7]|nr:hypothetical protein [Okeania sp. SIO2H7]
MGSRYADILRAESLMAQKRKYDQWNNKDLGEKAQLYRETLAARGSKISRTARIIAYICPFGVGAPSAAKMLLTVTTPDKDNAPSTATADPVGGGTAITIESAQALAGTLFGQIAFTDRIQITPPAAGTIVFEAPKGKNERPAIITLVEAGATKSVQSRITGRPYNSYPGAKSVSSPFGQTITAATAEKQETAVAALKGAWPSAYKVKFSPQKLKFLKKP